MKAIYIHKGDDTVFGEVSKFITATLKSKYDLTGYKGQFILGDIVLNFEDISSGKFEIILTDEETSRLEYGRHYGKIKVIDAEEHIKTICNTLLFIVTPEVIDTQNELIELDLTNSPEYQLILQVGEDVVYSVNGQTGNVDLTAEDVGALPSDTFIPSKLSDLNNDEGFVNAKYVEQGLEGKQDKGDYATREELDGKQDKGDYATREELDTKQDKGDYALREEIPDLTGYVKNTDYATGTVAGVVRVGSYVGTTALNGFLCGNPRTLEEYNSTINQTVIAKGTLENIKDDYVKRGITENNIELTDEEKTNARTWIGAVGNTDYATTVKGGVFTASTGYGTGVSGTSGNLYCRISTLDEYNTRVDSYFISKGTLDNIKDDYVKRGITENNIELTEDEKTSARTWLGAVGNTDYATLSQAGLVKPTAYFGTNVDSSGAIHSSPYTAEQLKSKSEYTFISKGTLENIKDDYVKRGITENSIELSEDEKAGAKQWLGYATQSDINTAIANLPQFKISVVDTLPETGEFKTLYLVPKDGEAPDVYNEYIWVDSTSTFELLGSTAVDLTDYVKNTDYANNSKGGVIKTSTNYGVQIGASGYLYGCIETLAGLATRNNHAFISKGTLENIKDDYVKRGLTENTLELTDDEKTSARTLIGAVGNTDYAGIDGSAGIIKTSSTYGVHMTSGGHIRAQVDTLDGYNLRGVNYLVGKGTLENIKNDLVKRAVTANDIELTDDEKTNARTWIGAISNTDYATSGSGIGGVVKVSGTFAVTTANGFIQPMTIPVGTRYDNLSQYAFIGKGTLENVLTQYSKTVLTTEADYEALETKDTNTLYLIEEE